uniref:Uncharacterized protein n=1 Tax=Anopheles epiroticus TaxID=199890 RepID=A0A182PME2_9DIPT
MKRVSDVEYKSVHVGKSLRSRNKRKCKRKKNARFFKRFAKEAFTPHNSAQYHHVPRHQPASMRPVGWDPCAEIRFKHAQNVWVRAYHRVVKWHTKHQTNYWKQCARQLRAENDRLKWSVLRARSSAIGGCPVRREQNTDSTDSDEDYHDEDDPFGDTEDESTDEWNGSDDRLQQRQQRRTCEDDDQGDKEAGDELDEEFLAFMEVSARHRLEHRRQKNESVH